MLKRILAGGPSRKTRFHDGKGNFVGWRRALRHAPPAAVTGLLRLLTGYRPETPWIAMSAIAELDKSLSKQSRVLEFGSGMSTIWFAKRAGMICSVEDYRPWYEKVKIHLEARGLGNVKYRLAENAQEYCSFGADEEAGFDLILVDGSHRSACVDKSRNLLRPGGILYLDNSDNSMAQSPDGADVKLAERYALELAQARNGTAVYFTDFAPTQLFANQGLMVRIPAAS